jgi:uncharacterized protein YbjT (DUF2867 family)
MILVTGATGKIGKELVLNLWARKSPFKVLARSKEVARDYEAKGIMAVRGDFEEPDSFGSALADIQAVFLLTTPQPNSVILERRFLAACKAMEVKRVVRLSAAGANPSPSSSRVKM